MSEEKREAEVYGLYVLPLSPQTLKAASAFRFQRVTADYILLYTQDPAPQGAVAVGEQDVHRLTKQEQEWVLDCAALLMRQAMAEHEVEARKRAGALLEQLQVELEREARKAREGGEEP